jgi:hypothetical protein
VSHRPSFRDIAPPLDVDDGSLARIADQMGVPTLVKPPARPPVHDRQTVQDAPREQPRPAPAPRPTDPPAVNRTAPAADPGRNTLEKLTVELPHYLMKAIKLDAVARDTTARHVVLLALQSAGFTVEPADLVPYAPRRKAVKP